MSFHVKPSGVWLTSLATWVLFRGLANSWSVLEMELEHKEQACGMLRVLEIPPLLRVLYLHL